MRVIAGKYRGRNLKSPPSLQVRPTSDRLRETLFNVIAPRIHEARFLDLCAGSGAIGIEALSRGAAHVTFVDQSRKMGTLIRANLDLCRIIETEYRIVQTEASEFLRKAARQHHENWDLIFFDPPYANDYLPTLKTIGSGDLLDEDGLLVVEHDKKKELPEFVGLINRVRIVKQGDSALSFYKRISMK